MKNLSSMTFLFSREEIKSFKFGTTQKWVNHDRIYIFSCSFKKVIHFQFPKSKQVHFVIGKNVGYLTV